MRRSVMLVVMLLLLSLAGCGANDDEEDPFVGTWNGAPDYPDYWVISKTADAYSVTGFIHLRSRRAPGRQADLLD